jgi:hypothetical protein
MTAADRAGNAAIDAMFESSGKIELRFSPQKISL